MGDAIYRPLIEDMVWSYSRVKTFADCRYRFFLKYIYGCEERDRFFASYGSYVHNLLEQYYTGSMPQERLPTEFLLGFQENVRGERPKESTVAKYIQNGAEYFRNFRPFEYETIGVEKRVDFRIDNMKFIGYLDYLGSDSNGLVLIDHKSRDMKPRSNRKKPTVKDAELDEMLRQLYIYSAAIHQEYGEFPYKLCFNCFRTNTLIEEQFSINAYHEAISWVKKEIRKIEEAEIFNPSIEFFSCCYICGVSEECIYCQTVRGGRHT